MIPNRKTPDIFGDVRLFLKLAQPDMMHKLGDRIQPDVAKLAWHLIDEEVNKELKEDLQKLIDGNYSLETLSRVFDHYLDIIYVAAWAVEAFGLPSAAGWNELQRANMTKFPVYEDQPHDEVTGTKALPMPQDYEGLAHITDWHVREGRFVLLNQETGKVIKPRGFIPPNLWEVINACLSIQQFRKMPTVLATPWLLEYFHKMEDRHEKGEIEL
jgi:hypothetical protein